ncbi:MAG: nicotinate-nucleotide--dimethylbenzimidazole phosphoribosyltransferase [Dethiosulfatibacter sp.]|nr:nicotinate-nucleotide--dimethylbenzimidazole phosphoribosyltransferase [Dethiosulfatibacter sp.]
MELLNNTLSRITDLDRESMNRSRTRIDNLVKPVGSLGRLEDLAVQVSGITGELFPDLSNKAIIVMASDNGVCEEGVTAAPQMVTKIQTINIANGVSGLGPLARLSGADLVVVDIGVMSDIEHDRVISRKIRYGTGNIAKGPAMSYDEAVKAIETGIEITEKEIKKGRRLIGTGEMGIGNTTSSTALLSVVTGMDPQSITGVGANLPLDKLDMKISVIRQAISVNNPDKRDPIDCLAKIGGLDIAGMTGIILACAANKVPCVIDGYISTISAILACQLSPLCKDYIISSHYSLEKGSKTASEYLGIKPMLYMDMRLGEGSGAALAFHIVESAVLMNRDMITFEESGINVV